MAAMSDRDKVQEPSLRVGIDIFVVPAAEFVRYLRWRLGVDILGTGTDFDHMLCTFGTDPIVVASDGRLASPGGRGQRGAR